MAKQMNAEMRRQMDEYNRATREVPNRRRKRHKKRRHAPKVDGYKAAIQRAAAVQGGDEECPFDVPETELDAEFKAIIG